MARRAIEMIEVKEVLYQWQQGRGKKTIAKSLGIARNTVREILSQAMGFGLTQDHTSADIDEVASLLQAKREKKTISANSVQAKISRWHEQIDQWRQEDHMTVVQMIRLLAEREEIISETSLRTYLKRHFPKIEPSTIHLETVAGQSSQVDFGYVGMMHDPKCQKARKCYAFVLTLSHSRHKYLRFVFNQDSETWIDCHIRSFEFFGGVPKTVILDNLKSGVIKPDVYDPSINRSYGDLERHYGFIADPAKVRTPQHKGVVERNILTVKQQVIAGREYKDINEANEYALTWCRDEIAHRVVRTTGKTPWELFSQEEKAELLELPEKVFEQSHWQQAKVHKDQHIVFKGSFYSLPYSFIGNTVWVKGTKSFVQIYHQERLIKTHPAAEQKSQWVTDNSDYPEHARRFIEKDREACLLEALEIGESVHEYLLSFYSLECWTYRRKAHAVLRLATTYGARRLNQACAYAIEFENHQYESLKNILENGYDERLIVTHPKPMPDHSGYLRDPNEFGPLH